MQEKTGFKFRPVHQACENCKHFTEYYNTSGWCRDEVNTQIFNGGLMVYKQDCCDRFEAREFDRTG
jgi:hypothetical protein